MAVFVLMLLEELWVAVGFSYGKMLGSNGKTNRNSRDNETNCYVTVRRATDRGMASFK